MRISLKWWLVGAMALGAAALPLVGMAANGAPTLNLFQQIYQDLNQEYVTPLDGGTLLTGAINGMIKTLHDPYTEYFSPTELKSFDQSLNGQLAGVGVVILQAGSDVAVSSVVPDSPAAKAGLQAGDRLLTINGKTLTGQSIDAAAGLIRGAVGSLANFRVQRGSRVLKITVTRGLVQIPTVTYRMLPSKVAYITLNQFSGDAAAAMATALKSLAPDKPLGYILDLRENPGGLVDQAVSVADDFIPKGTVVSFRGRTGAPLIYRSKSGVSRGPVVVLVDGGTASAAEILAGALRDDLHAPLVGQTTFGKGVAQDLIPLSNGGALKVTVERWYTPDGQNVTGHGLTPDFTAAGYEAPIVAAERLLNVSAATSISFKLGDDNAHVDGVRVALDAGPKLIDGHLYITQFAANEALGVLTSFDKATSTAVAMYDKTVIDLPINSPTAMVNGAPETVNAPAKMEQGVLYLPLAFLAQHASYFLVHNGSTVLLTK